MHDSVTLISTFVVIMTHVYCVLPVIHVELETSSLIMFAVSVMLLMTEGS